MAQYDVYIRALYYFGILENNEITLFYTYTGTVH